MMTKVGRQKVDKMIKHAENLLYKKAKCKYCDRTYHYSKTLGDLNGGVCFRATCIIRERGNDKSRAQNVKEIKHE